MTENRDIPDVQRALFLKMMSIVVQPELTLVQGKTGAGMVAPVVLLDFDYSARSPVDALATILREAGARVIVQKVADPRENKRVLLTRILAQSEAEFQAMPILAGFGLAANLALCLASGAKDKLRAVLAVGPFVGFDAPMFGRSRRNATWFTENLLQMSRMRLLSGIANHVECTRVLPGFRSPSAGAVSWGQLAACVPHSSFAGVVSTIACPTVIVLDGADEDLDHERANNQILAMNSRLRISLQDLANVRPAEVLRIAQQQLDS